MHWWWLGDFTDGFRIFSFLELKIWSVNNASANPASSWDSVMVSLKGMSLAKEDLLPQLVAVQESGKTNWSANLPLCKKLSSSQASVIHASLPPVAGSLGTPTAHSMTCVFKEVLCCLFTIRVLHNRVTINWEHTCMNISCIFFSFWKKKKICGLM